LGSRARALALASARRTTGAAAGEAASAPITPHLKALLSILVLKHKDDSRCNWNRTLSNDRLYVIVKLALSVVR